MMQSKRFHRRSFAERASLHNRAPQVDDTFSLPPGGVTITIINPPTATASSSTVLQFTTTIFISTESSTSTSSSSSSTSLTTQSTTSTSAISSSNTATLSNTATQTTDDPSPSVIPIPESASSSSSTAGTTPSAADSSGAVTTTKLPAGAIAGIIIGVVIIFLFAAFLLVRKRYMQHRQARRSTWTTRKPVGFDATTGLMTEKGGGYGGSSGSFLPIERPETINTFFPAQRSAPPPPPMVTTPMAETGRMSPGRTFASAQATAMYSMSTAGAPPPPATPPFASYAALMPPVVIPPPPTTYNNPPSAEGISPRTTLATLPPDAATVKFTFIPTLPDELSISNGEVIRVLQEYDDGWALCVNGRDKKGMVPLECLDRGEGVANADQLGVFSQPGDYRNSRRVSSLVMEQ